MTRHCAKCATEVEDRGGYCALGHRLRLGSVDGSIDSLRAEIDEVFEAARLEVSGVLEGRDGAPPPPPPVAPTGTGAHVAPTGEDVPTADDYKQRARGVWAALEEDVSMDDDPIEAFAPPPRMDWGPKRSTLLGRFSNPRRPSNATV